MFLVFLIWASWVGGDKQLSPLQKGRATAWVSNGKPIPRMSPAGPGAVQSQKHNQRRGAPHNLALDGDIHPNPGPGRTSQVTGFPYGAGTPGPPQSCRAARTSRPHFQHPHQPPFGSHVPERSHKQAEAPARQRDAWAVPQASAGESAKGNYPGPTTSGDHRGNRPGGNASRTSKAPMSSPVQHIGTPGNDGRSGAEDLRPIWPVGSQPESHQPSRGGSSGVYIDRQCSVCHHAVNLASQVLWETLQDSSHGQGRNQDGYHTRDAGRERHPPERRPPGGGYPKGQTNAQTSRAKVNSQFTKSAIYDGMIDQLNALANTIAKLQSDLSAIQSTMHTTPGTNVPISPHTPRPSKKAAPQKGGTTSIGFTTPSRKERPSHSG